MDSKAKADARCRKQRQVVDTLERHIFTFMTHKFGLKSIVREQMALLLTAIAEHRAGDIEVEVVAKALQNEVDEEFYFVLKEYRQSLADQLKRCLAAKYRNKTSDQIQALAHLRQASSLPEDEWTALAASMVPEAGEAQAVDELRILALQMQAWQGARAKAPASQAGRRSASSEGGGREGALGYGLLEEYLLHRHLTHHVALIAPVVRAFKRADTEQQGQLKRAQFSNMCNLINSGMSRGMVQAVWGLVDPSNTGLANFSACAGLYLQAAMQADA